jgi:hypothetical protein
MLCDARQHFWADFIAIMKGENIIRPAITDKCFVRTGLSFDLPAQPQKRSEKALGFDRRPLAYAAIGIEMFMAKGRLSLCSSRSAITRRARISAFDTASSEVAP